MAHKYRLIIGGVPTKKAQVLNHLFNYGSSARTWIIQCVWGNSPLTYRRDTLRGWNSNIFTQMHADGVVRYDKQTKEWSITDKGYNLLKEWNLLKQITY